MSLRRVAQAFLVGVNLRPKIFSKKIPEEEQVESDLDIWIQEKLQKKKTESF